MSKLVYKIQRMSDGKFSTGGLSPRFTTKGKTWTSMGNLKNHLHLVSGRGYSERYQAHYAQRYKVYDNCIVVMYELVEPKEFGFQSDLIAEYRPQVLRRHK